MIKILTIEYDNRGKETQRTIHFAIKPSIGECIEIGTRTYRIENITYCTRKYKIEFEQYDIVMQIRYAYDTGE